MLNPDNGIEVPVGVVRSLIDEGAVPEKVRLIDCREEDEFAICKISGAELVPLSSFADRDFSTLLTEDQPAVFYCHHGIRSGQAAEFLREKGYPLVFSMGGGIERWSVEIDPTVPRY